MKRQLFYLKWLPMACLLIFAGLIAWTDGGGKRRNILQDDPTKHPLPHMYLKMAVSAQEEQNFKPFAKVLSTHLSNGPETESFSYDTSAFLGMGRALGQLASAKYLEVFLAVYGAAGTLNVPAGLENKLMLLYAPTDANGNQLGYFYLPDKAVGFSLTNNKIPDSIANNWKANYLNTVVQWLNPFLDTSDTYNYENNDFSNPLTNTIKVKYYLSDFDELKKEIDYQVSAHTDTITGFTAFFSALPKKPGPKDGALNNRLKVEFEFMQQDKRIFYIDTTPGFSQRKPQPPHFPFTGKGLVLPRGRGLDNGQMCPPTCNP